MKAGWEPQSQAMLLGFPAKQPPLPSAATACVPPYPPTTLMCYSYGILILHPCQCPCQWMHRSCLPLHSCMHCTRLMVVHTTVLRAQGPQSCTRRMKLPVAWADMLTRFAVFHAHEGTGHPSWHAHQVCCVSCTWRYQSPELTCSPGLLCFMHMKVPVTRAVVRGQGVWPGSGHLELRGDSGRDAG